MLPHGQDYEQVYNGSRWMIPEHYNIGVDVCDKWAKTDPGKLALIFVDSDGTSRNYSFGELREWSNRIANLLAAHGIERGDRVGILLTQSPEAAFGHIAALKLGAISVPLFVLFGIDALSYRLADSGVRAVITDALMLPRPGIMGKAVPGHRVEIIDSAGYPCPKGEPGVIGIHRGDPVMFLGYWNNLEDTVAKFSGDWLLTRDTAVKEDGNWIRFVGRTDDIIASAGYRIGPSEIEDCALRHPQSS